MECLMITYLIAVAAPAPPLNSGGMEGKKESDGVGQKLTTKREH